MHDRPAPASVAVPTGSPLIEAERLRLLRELAPILRLMEVRHEVESSMLAQAIADGRLPDTEEITGWLIAWHRFCLIRDSRSARDGTPG